MYVKVLMPDLHDFFEDNMVSSQFYASGWLFTFFAVDFPIDFVFMAIDLFLLEGYSSFIKIILAILSSIRDSLKEMDCDEALVFFKTFAKSLLTDLDTFFCKANTFRVSRRQMKVLEYFFKQGVSKETV